MEENNKSIALLIDSENISSKYMDLIIDEANKYGSITYRRIYGDWTNEQYDYPTNSVQVIVFELTQQVNKRLNRVPLNPLRLNR